MKRQFLAIVHSPTRDRPIIALILLLFGVFILALQDVTVKLIAHETSFWQFQTLRSFGNGLFLASLAWFSGGFGILVPKSWRPVYFRASMITICMFFFSGAPHLSVAQMTAGLHLSIICVVARRSSPRWKIGAVAHQRHHYWHERGLANPWSVSCQFFTSQLLPIAAGFFTRATF